MNLFKYRHICLICLFIFFLLVVNFISLSIENDNDLDEKDLSIHPRKDVLIFFGHIFIYERNFINYFTLFRNKFNFGLFSKNRLISFLNSCTSLAGNSIFFNYFSLLVIILYYTNKSYLDRKVFSSDRSFIILKFREFHFQKILLSFVGRYIINE